MPDPVLHVLAGPNGAGKTTFYERVLEPATHLELVNADRIAAARWPGAPAAHAYDAAALAAEDRATRLAAGRSFATETVFSHPSKLALLREARAAGHLVTLHVMLITEELAVARVAARVTAGGHEVPVTKVRERFARLWDLIADAIGLVQDARVYDNSRAATPYRLVATFRDGALVAPPTWPGWTPAALRRPG